MCWESAVLLALGLGCHLSLSTTTSLAPQGFPMQKRASHVLLPRHRVSFILLWPQISAKLWHLTSE